MSTPEVFFRETIDLGRYSNSVSRKFVSTYNDIIVASAKKLRQIDLRQQAAAEGVIVAPQTRKRLRAIIAQSKTSLNTWAKTTTKEMTQELQGLALLQTDFIKNELQKVTASGDVPINSVAVSPKYAESFVTTDPTQVNIFTSKQFTEDDFVKFGSGKFELTARQGAAITLPNGQTVEKAFRGIAERQQEQLARHIRQGVFSGESTQQIARRMIGRLDFGQKGNVRQIAAAGGEVTKLANYQVRTIVRTSINQVQNQASQAVYAANKKVSPKYEYVATLDSRTSAICMRLDGQEFEYNKGPTPPQHFNCRSTTVPVVDFDGLQKKYPNLEKPPATQFDTRPSATGRVPQGTSYGNWLLDQDRKLQVKTLGNEGKVNFFKKLAKREGSGQAALRKMIRTDGSERSLKDLERLYGKPRDITIRTKTPKPVVKPVAFERRLVDSSPDQLRKAGKELMEEVGVLDVNKLKKLDAEYVKTAKEAATNMAALDKFDKAKNAYLKYKESFTNSLEKLRNKMLDTPLNDTQIDKFIKNVKITTFNAAQKTELRGQLNEYIRMFNGNGFVDSANGIPAITKIGKAQRASCKFWEGSMTASARTRKVGSKFLNVRKATTFHEISHSVEVANPKLNKYLNKWKLDKGFTDKDKIIDAMQNKKASIVKKPTEKLGKPVYKLEDIRRGGYRKDEVALVNEYISPYMGKVYEPYDFSKFGITLDTEPSEVLSMSIERFAGTESMTKLLMQHPDLFEIVVGMSRATGL
jgi:SPP1 gp7 family putative phage head morphogenesis protein